jgi:hypothetical protein
LARGLPPTYVSLHFMSMLCIPCKFKNFLRPGGWDAQRHEKKDSLGGVGMLVAGLTGSSRPTSTPCLVSGLRDQLPATKSTPPPTPRTEKLWSSCWHFLTSLLGGVSSQQRRQGMPDWYVLTIIERSASARIYRCSISPRSIQGIVIYIFPRDCEIV